MSTEAANTGWLIEQIAAGPSPASWFTGDGFSTDSLEAVRFTRRDDAQKLLDRMLKRKEASAESWELFRVRLGADNFTVTEHQWGLSPEPGALQATTATVAYAANPAPHAAAPAAPSGVYWGNSNLSGIGARSLVEVSAPDGRQQVSTLHDAGSNPAERAILDDGFGNRWQKCGPDCRMQIVRPGKVQCDCEQPETKEAK